MQKAHVILKLAQRARQASFAMAAVSSAKKNSVLKAMAQALLAKSDYIIRENAKDLRIAQQEKYSAALIDRLTLNPARMKAMAQSVRETAMLDDGLGEVLATIQRPNGLKIQKIRVPLGVVGIIYESRPNVTCDCAVLSFKSGNAVILKGGKEALFSNRAIYQVIKKVLVQHGMPQDAISLLDTADRKAVQELLALDNYIDVIVPRGGESLIRFVAEHSKIPVIKHFKGVCHVYVSRFADLDMAQKIVLNAKTQKPGVCNAMETLLVDRNIAGRFLPGMVEALVKAGCRIKGDASARRLVKGLAVAKAQDWSTEYLDLVLNVGVVDGVDAAIHHINTFGSHHSDCIVTKNQREGQRFTAAVDSACVYTNASTRFTDGFEFGFGAEVGISTDKLHVRGPMALEGLTTYKYVINGNGQVRQ